MVNKILILGSQGMLGQELVKVFQDVQPICWDRPEIDIADPKQVEEKITPLQPELIINAAAYTEVDGAETEQELAKRINGQAVGYLASLSQKIGALLVHYSTDYVFDGQKKQGYQEDDQPNPINAYGQSKLLGEKLLQAKSQKYYLIRTSGLFGQQGKNFVKTILQLAQEKDILKIVNDQHFKPTYAVDLAQRTRELIAAKPDFGIYHLTNEGPTTWYDFTQEILRQVRQGGTNKGTVLVPCSSTQFPRPAQRPKYSILLNTKLKPLRPWSTALAEYISGIRGQCLRLRPR